MRCPSCNELLDLQGVKFCPACGNGLVAYVDPLVGQLIGGRYRISYLLAEGGMGRVYAAEQTMGATSRKVAIKVLLAEYSGRDQDVQRLSRECGTVAELDHPNTIKFYDFGETQDGDLFIAMEFLQGDSLSQVVKQGPMAPERVDLIIGQICGSLQEAHRRGIIHRDLKPDNIILTSPGGTPDFVKVLDFGIAKRVGGRDPKLTPLGVVLGSPPYMSPEQFTMQDVDHRSDIYSLAIVAYQMLTGKLPFNANDPIEWAALHMGAHPLPIDGHGVPIPPQMREAIHSSLAKEPIQRPQSMREFYSEFTIGVGTLESGRLSSMMPLVPSQIPLPPNFSKSSFPPPASSPPVPAAYAVQSADVSVSSAGEASIAASNPIAFSQRPTVEPTGGPKSRAHERREKARSPLSTRSGALPQSKVSAVAWSMPPMYAGLDPGQTAPATNVESQFDAARHPSTPLLTPEAPFGSSPVPVILAPAIVEDDRESVPTRVREPEDEDASTRVREGDDEASTRIKEEGPLTARDTKPPTMSLRSPAANGSSDKGWHEEGPNSVTNVLDEPDLPMFKGEGDLPIAKPRGQGTSVMGPEALAPPPEAAIAEPANSMTATAAHIQDFSTSSPELSVSKLPSITEAIRSSKGTLVMKASDPPPKIPKADIIPPTIRDPELLKKAMRRATRRTMLWVAVVLVVVGATTSALTWYFYLRPTNTKPKKPKTSATVTSAPTTP